MIGFHFDLRHSLDCDRYTLLRVEILLRCDVKRHEFQRKLAPVLHHREDQRAFAIDDARSSKSIHEDRFVWSSFPIEVGQKTHQQQEHEYAYTDHYPELHRIAKHSAS